MLRNTIFGLLVLALTSVSAEAATVTINTSIGAYDVTTVTGTYADLSPTLNAQPWWHVGSMALEFANATSTQLGLPNASGTLGPDFGFDTFTQTLPYPGGTLTVINSATWDSSLGTAKYTAFGPAASVTWAIATPSESPVPEPNTTALMVFGLITVVLAGKRGGIIRARPWLSLR